MHRGPDDGRSELVRDFAADLDRFMRRQLWTVIVVLAVTIVVMSTIFGGLLAAFGRETGASIATLVFATIAVSAGIFGMLRKDSL